MDSSDLLPSIRQHPLKSRSRPKQKKARLLSVITISQWRSASTMMRIVLMLSSPSPKTARLKRTLTGMWSSISPPENMNTRTSCFRSISYSTATQLWTGSWATWRTMEWSRKQWTSSSVSKRMCWIQFPGISCLWLHWTSPRRERQCARCLRTSILAVFLSRCLSLLPQLMPQETLTWEKTGCSVEIQFAVSVTRWEQTCSMGLMRLPSWQRFVSIQAIWTSSLERQTQSPAKRKMFWDFLMNRT